MRSQRNQREVEKNLVKAEKRFENGKHEEALEMVERVLEIDPENSKAEYLKEEIEAVSQ